MHASSVTSDRKNLYNYRRFVFELDSAGLSLSDLTEKELLLAVYADIYYKGDVNYEEPAYGTLCLYDYITEIEDCRLTRKDRAAIKDYLEEK